MCGPSRLASRRPGRGGIGLGGPCAGTGASRRRGEEAGVEGERGARVGAGGRGGPGGESRPETGVTVGRDPSGSRVRVLDAGRGRSGGSVTARPPPPRRRHWLLFTLCRTSSRPSRLSGTDNQPTTPPFRRSWLHSSSARRVAATRRHPRRPSTSDASSSGTTTRRGRRPCPTSTSSLLRRWRSGRCARGCTCCSGRSTLGFRPRPAPAESVRKAQEADDEVAAVGAADGDRRERARGKTRRRLDTRDERLCESFGVAKGGGTQGRGCERGKRRKCRRRCH